MDWTKTRKAQLFRNSSPIYLRVFGRELPQRGTIIGVHALMALEHEAGKLITIVGSTNDVGELKDIVGNCKVRLLNFQKALRAKHHGLLLISEPSETPDVERMVELLDRIKQDVAKTTMVTN